MSQIPSSSTPQNETTYTPSSDTFHKMDSSLALPEPWIDIHPLNSKFGMVMSKYLSRSVCFTTAHPWISEKAHTDQPARYLGLQSPIRALGTNFLVDLSRFERFSFPTWTPTTDAEIRTCSHLERTIFDMMKTFSEVFHTRDTEFMQALIFIERVITSVDRSSSLTLTADNLPLALLTSVMLANKMSADDPYTTATWAKYFGCKLDILVQSEAFFVKTLNCAFHVSEEEFLSASNLKWKLLAALETSLVCAQHPAQRTTVVSSA